jgi:deoxyribonuclease V
MIGCVDVDYRDKRAVAGGIAFRDWLDDNVVAERAVSLQGIQPYQSGQFFIRELPCLLAVLRVLPPLEHTRGKSKIPLFVSAAGLSVRQAAEHVYSMGGPYRIPTLLKRVDLLSKTLYP